MKTQADKTYTLQTYTRKVAESNLNISELADFFYHSKDVLLKLRGI